MIWKVNFADEGEEDFGKLDGEIRERIFDKIIWLRDNFDQVVSLPLTNQWRGFFKLRVGDWRVIYNVSNKLKEITIQRIDRRDKVYKRK